MPSNRRSFFRQIAGVAGAAGAASLPALASAYHPPARRLPPRQEAALQIRTTAAVAQSLAPAPGSLNNGDEANLPGYIGSFTKGLPENQLGEVDASAYETLLHALSTGRHADFEDVTRGSGMKLVNPESAFTFGLEGADSQCLACPPAPNLSSAAAAADMVELYWKALARDVPFAEYGSSPLIQDAARDLARLSGFAGPREADGTIGAATIFRGVAPGCLDGPYISQFLWKPVPVNSTWVDQRYRVPAAGTDYLTDYAEWVVIESGLPPYRDPSFDPTPRYISNARALAEWVHYDFLYQAFHNAALILINAAPETILDVNPYWSPQNPYKTSKVQTGFTTFGPAHICGWLGRVTTAALQAAWYQKWSVHRRLRPEEFGGRVHNALTGAAKYPISQELLKSAAVARAHQTNGTYLLPQAFPEGCPLHPSYPAGHATVSGACSALLKAFFDENGLITGAVAASSDGSSLAPLTDIALTVGGKVNKLAYNIAFGRNFSGIHYRSDAMAGFRLGEDVAITMIQDLVNTYTESFAGFQFTRLDGTPVQIVPGQEELITHER